jgi:hypothetical protein
MTQADPVLKALAEELQGYPAPPSQPQHMPHGDAQVFVPLQLQSPAGALSIISTITVFGTPHDITLSELALETFFPADAATMHTLRRLADTPAQATGPVAP